MSNVLIKNCRLLGENNDCYLHIKDGLIHKINNLYQPMSYDKIIDADSNTVLPGLNDSHIHLLSLSLNNRLLNIRGEITENQLAEICKNANPNYGDWIVGKGYDENKFGSNFSLDKTFLDQYCKDTPTIFYRVCGHVAVLNTVALKKLGITVDTEVSGGEILKDSSGELTGVITEKALGLIKLPKLDDEELVNILTSGIKSIKEMGLTSVQTDDLSLVNDYKTLWNIYLRAVGKEPLRVYLHYNANSINDIKKAAKVFTEIENTTHVKKGSIKIFLDGSLGARTAALKDEYTDRPNYRGVLTYSDCELEKMVEEATKNHMQLALHAIGDKAMEQGINVIKKSKNQKLRHRIIHCQVTDNKIIRDMADLNIIAEVQPAFLITDMDWAENRLGERINGCYAFKTMTKKGVTVSGGSDCPVEPANPFLGIYSAVTRTNLSHQPEGGWLPNEKLSLKEAIKIYTQGSAYASFDENKKGLIKEGYYGDLIILDRNIEKADKTRLKDIKVTKTLIAPMN
ncbi:amidohydrolase [Proteinivorax tanatarense]|uniref:Amidohydrolase n=1 Tax=Proteinivorax tanatarense TaxID=1260629 RepID=A0AAU7VQF7_9FIRM